MTGADALFQPIRVGPVTLQHRIVLAPLSRERAYASHVPGPHAATYYAQRASAPGTLLISKATVVSHYAGGQEHVPGICTDEQIEAWKKITDAVHAKGSYIFCQIWAQGRAAVPSVLAKHDPPLSYVSASSITLMGKAEPPRPLTEAEIADYIEAFATAARNAVNRAGFDGVEIHAANGYLIDQFIQSVSNIRTDKWGGVEEGRTRFAREIVAACVKAIGQEKVAIRLSPWSSFQDMKMPNPRPTFSYLVRDLRDAHPNMAYLHVVEARIAGGADTTPGEHEDNDFLREIWHGGEDGKKRVFISAGGYTRETVLSTAEAKGDLIAFGRLFVPNPDLPIRIQKSIPFTPPDRSTYHLTGNLTPYGYSDWLFADGRVEEVQA